MPPFTDELARLKSALHGTNSKIGAEYGNIGWMADRRDQSLPIRRKIA
jgi:hypothetical protein